MGLDIKLFTVMSSLLPYVHFMKVLITIGLLLNPYDHFFMLKKYTLLLILMAFIIDPLLAQTVTTLAGSITGFANGQGTNAKFNYPNGICTDGFGNVYVADAGNHKIRKITPGGVVTTFAGSTQGYADGQDTSAQFNTPFDVFADANNNIYVADEQNNKIRKITPSGLVSTLAGSSSGYQDGNSTTAKFKLPMGICIDTAGNILVADGGNHKIRKITPGGVVSTLAGSTQGFANGSGIQAQFNYPTDLCADALGNIFIADRYNHCIRIMTYAGVVTTFTGGTSGYADGVGLNAQFNAPTGVAVDNNNNILVSDQGNHKIRKITQGAVVTTLAGSTMGNADGIGSTAQFNSPKDICVFSGGTIYVSDNSNHRIRSIMGLPTSLWSSPTISEVSIYPNPAQHALQVHFMASQNTPTILRLLDLFGREVKCFTSSSSNGEYAQSINISDLPNGIYILRIGGEDKQPYSARVIKQ